MKDVAIKSKILEATINSIERCGIEDCTIRNIAKEAGVTLSSVHYYFESKDVLVNMALDQAITNSFVDISNIWNECRPDCKAALSKILGFLFEGAVRYPGITRAGLQPLLMQGKTNGTFIVKLNEFLAGISVELAERSNLKPEQIGFYLIQAFSTVLFLGISTDAYKDFSSLSFKDASSRDRIIDNLVSGIVC